MTRNSSVLTITYYYVILLFFKAKKRDFLQLLLEAETANIDYSMFHRTKNERLDFANIHNEKKMSIDVSFLTKLLNRTLRYFKNFEFRK
jgi:hypothetical protein